MQVTACTSFSIATSTEGREGEVMMQQEWVETQATPGRR
jgi:hypothetical protein